MIICENHGALLVATNYWESDAAKAGKLFVSPNAGAVRVLLPASMRPVINDLRGAEYVIISRGPWPDAGLQDGVEILWEDHSDSPYCWHLSPESFALLPGDPEPGQQWIISVWDDKKGKPHKALERPCHWRRVPNIPWLKPLTQ